MQPISAMSLLLSLMGRKYEVKGVPYTSTDLVLQAQLLCSSEIWKNSFP